MAEPMAEKIVQPAIDPEHTASCPTMDLIALATIDKQVHVFRYNGQKVFGVSNREELGRVSQIQWKPNGQILAVALNGHDLILTNSHTGKKVHRIDYSKSSKSPISCVGWGLTFTESASLSKRLKDSNDRVTLEDVISRNPSIKDIEFPPDLPSELAFLDVEGSLPKLSPLSSGNIEDDTFSSRASMDSIFDVSASSSIDAADVLVVGFEDGTVHLSVYDFFEIGTFSIAPHSRGKDNLEPIKHCSHPYSTTHALLASTRDELKIVPIDLRLISSAGRYLPFLASKATRLQNILRYISQVQKQIQGDFRMSQELPKRFIGNIEDDLKANSDCTWEQAAYHLVVTGNCYPEVRDWLVDQVGERGYKRWDKAVTAGYESVQRLLHEHLLPALERFTVITSRLRGLSRFQVSNANLGLSTNDLNRILDAVSCLQLLGHHLLIITTTEFQQFRAFSAWLHQEIDIQASEASTADNVEKDPNIDHLQTLKYIQGPMTQSRLVDFVNPKEPIESSAQWDLNAEGGRLFELYKRELKDHPSKGSPKQLPGLKDLLKHLEGLCSIFFNKIGETQRRSIRVAPSVSLGAGRSDMTDLRMVAEKPERIEEICVYVAMGPRLGNEIVQIYRIKMINENGMSTTRSVEYVSFRTASWTVQDIKFVDDKEIMLAVSNESFSRLLRINYHPNDKPNGALQYRNVDDTRDTSYPVDFSKSGEVSQYTWLEFPRGDSWSPETIEVNGRKGRRAVYVFTQDRRHYRVYDLEMSYGAEDEADESVQSDSVMRD